MLRQEVRHTFGLGRPTKFKFGTLTKYKEYIHTYIYIYIYHRQLKRRDLQGQRSWLQGHVMRLTGVRL